MLRKGESQLRAGRANPEQQHFRTSWARSSEVNFHNISQIKWECPPRFMVDPNWKVEAGSESQETNIQLQRESKTAEVIYLSNSYIPANPRVALDALDFNGDDSIVPIIPLDVIDDETSPDDNDDDGIPLITLSPTAKVTETTTQALNVSHQGPQVKDRPEVCPQPLLQRDEVKATALALVALMKSKEPGSQIDLELLIQLLRNPGMIEQLMKDGQLQEKSTFPKPARISVNPVVKTTTPISIPGTTTENLAHSSWLPSVPFAHSMSREVKNVIERIPESRSSFSMPMTMMTSVTVIEPSPSSCKFDVGKVRKIINEYGVPLENSSTPSGPTTGAVVIKDSDYYRRLVSQHGMMTRENPDPHGSQERKPCVYFNSPRGCRRGSSCWFQHVKGNIRAVEEQPFAKRMKPFGGNFARQ